MYTCDQLQFCARSGRTLETSHGPVKEAERGVKRRLSNMKLCAVVWPGFSVAGS